MKFSFDSPVIHINMFKSVSKLEAKNKTANGVKIPSAPPMLVVKCTLLYLHSMEDEGAEKLCSDSDESEKKDDIRFLKVKWTHEEVSGG